MALSRSITRQGRDLHERNHAIGLMLQEMDRLPRRLLPDP
jgi:hypothetical protein